MIEIKNEDKIYCFFGDGTIGAGTKTANNKEIGILEFKNTKKSYKIGERVDDDGALESSVVTLFFENKKSIDVIIKCLKKIKRKMK